MSPWGWACALAVGMAGSAWLAWAVPSALRLASMERQAWGTGHPHMLRRLDLLVSPSRALVPVAWMVSAGLHVLLGASLVHVVARRCPPHGPVLAGVLLTLWLLFCSQMASCGRNGIWTGVGLRLSILPLWAMVCLLAPLGRTLHQGTEAILRTMGAAKPRVVTEGELLTGVELGGELGILRTDERGMVEGILGLETTTASEVMTPRVDLVGVPAEGTTDEWLAIARGVRFRFLPVFRGSMDTIEGMLDLVRFLLDPRHDRTAAVEAPLLVAETAPLHELLVALQRRDTRCAVVLDEYGGTAGLVTRGDILEEITADVEGEYAPETPPIQALGDGTWLVDGKTSLDDLRDGTGLELASVNSDRISGWVLEQAGHLPKLGETVAAQGCRATVRRLRKHRIVELQLERLATPGTVAEDSGVVA